MIWTAMVSGTKVLTFAVEAFTQPGSGLEFRGLAADVEHRMSAMRILVGDAARRRRIVVKIDPVWTDAPAPGHVRGGLELAVALAIRRVDQPRSEAPVMVIGDLGPTGRVSAVRGALPVASHACELGASVVASASNETELRWSRCKAAFVTSFEEAAEAVRGGLEFFRMPGPPPPFAAPPVEMSTVGARWDVTAQDAELGEAVRAGRRALLVGRPGSGAVILARRASTHLGPMTEEEQIELAHVRSAASVLREHSSLHRPFRAPHHTASLGAIIGASRDGGLVMPGELSLAHRGVLFFDEAMMFRSGILEAAEKMSREGMDTPASRLPASAYLLARVEPCRCDATVEADCRCSKATRRSHDAAIRSLQEMFPVRIDVPDARR